MRDQVANVVETYLAGLAARELASVAFHPDITFEGPVGPPIKGAFTVREFLTGLPAPKQIRIVRHIIEGEWCATVLEVETRVGVIPIMDCFQVIEGQIVSIRPYYDPRPLLEARRQAGSSA